MSLYELTNWKVSCDKCGASTIIVSSGDWTPSYSEVLNHGYHPVAEKHEGEYDYRHYCSHCYQEMMQDEG